MCSLSLDWSYTSNEGLSPQRIENHQKTQEENLDDWNSVDALVLMSHMNNQQQNTF